MNLINIIRTLILMGLTLMSVSSYALTAKNIETTSRVGEKLRAEIPLSKINIASTKNINVSIASKASHKRFSVKYEAVNKSINVSVKQRKGLGYYILVTSSVPIKTTSLNLLVNLKQGAKNSFRLYVLRLMRKSMIVSAKRPAELAIKKPVATAKEPIIVAAKKPVQKKQSEKKSEPVKVEVVTSDPIKVPQNAQAKQLQSETTIDSYHVDLRADEHLKIPGDPGELVVWIGDEAYKPDQETGKASATTTVPAIGQTAKVVPFAPTFKVDPVEYVCMKVHPTGSVATFSLTPLKTGDHEIGATVHMFESDDCSGAPVPKSVKKLHITVVVGTGEILEGYGMQLWNKFWEEALAFWGLIIATMFGLLLFLIRKKLKSLFGYESNS